MATALSISTNTLTTFLSLNALQSDQLAQLLMESIAFKQGDDNFDSTSEAIKLCEQTLNILHIIQIQTKNKELCKSNTKIKLSVKPNRLSNLSHDVLFAMCDYLDSFSKAHLRFTSMTTHIDMIGCPLDLIQIKTTNKLSPRGLIPLVRSCAKTSIVRRQRTTNLCGCDASRQLQLIDLTTAEVNQALCGDLTESQLSLLGIGRSWSITGIRFAEYDATADFEEVCDVINKYGVVRSVKRLNLCLKNGNEDVIDTLNTCGIAGYIEDICIDGWKMTHPIKLNFLHSFKRLRCIDIYDMSIDGSLNDFVKYSPQIEELILTDIDISGDISCLAQLRNIKTVSIDLNGGDIYKIYGDICSLSVCTKLTGLLIDSENVTGNISSLITLTNLEFLSLYDTKVEGNIESLLKYLPKLKDLHFINNYDLTGELVLTGNIELETLNVYNNDMHLELSSLTQLKKLESLKTKGYIEGDVSVISGLTELKTLEIERCPQITGNINSLATLPKLRKLKLGSLPNITGDVSLFSHIPCDVYYCNNIVGSD